MIIVEVIGVTLLAGDFGAAFYIQGQEDDDGNSDWFWTGPFGGFYPDEVHHPEDDEDDYGRSTH